MEASCSGRCLDAESFTFTRHRSSFGHLSAAPLRSANLHQAGTHLEARALLCCSRKSVGQKLQQQSDKGNSRRQVSCAAAPAVEIISSGEVADVEEIEGLRVVMNEYKRPMVEYLIKWKVQPHILAIQSHICSNI